MMVVWLLGVLWRNRELKGLIIVVFGLKAAEIQGDLSVTMHGQAEFSGSYYYECLSPFLTQPAYLTLLVGNTSWR
ncbi:MAG: hypothetical protein ACI93R_000108 [Flavobacteriales bacterium]|jgi:hypothetical protein